MAVNPNDAIEGKKINITTRKQVAQGLVEINGIGRCFKFLCSKNVRTCIMQESIPKVAVHFLNAMLNKGDNLEGQAIEVLSYNLLKFSIISNRTNVHGIQASDTHKFGAARIRIPFHFCLPQTN
jgi:hypothetical protein